MNSGDKKVVPGPNLISRRNHLILLTFLSRLFSVTTKVASLDIYLFLYTVVLPYCSYLHPVPSILSLSRAYQY